MEKEFIPYEQAVELKELGYVGIDFAGWCHAWENNPNPYFRANLDEAPYDVSAPLYQQAFKFFKEKYYHYAFLQPTSDLISENYCFKILDQYSGKFYSKSYDTYEEAQLECLKKLIEICKK